MTDVEAKTPTKRRLPEKKDPGSLKKQKISPKKQNKKLNQTNNVQNKTETLKGNKKNTENKNGSPKKIKPFVGTSKIVPSKPQAEGNKQVAQQNKEKKEGKKPRKNELAALRSKINTEGKDIALKSIEEKIKAIESRGELTKTGRRRLKLLHRIKRIAFEENADQSQPQKVVGNKSQQKNNSEGNKKGTGAVNASQANIGKKNVMKTAVKGQKINELNKKQVIVESKQVNKKIKKLQTVEMEESSDEDESDNELAEGEESESDEEIGEEQDEMESDNDSGDEDDEEESDEVEGEEDEESDEDESEEDSPPVQVSNKKQKKK